MSVSPSYTPIRIEPPETRVHALDALRAFVLLLGVTYHTVRRHGVQENLGDATSWLLGWFVTYTHCFRLPVFFLLSGFFACAMIQRRGMVAFLHDRARRILLVLVVAAFLIYLLKPICKALLLLGAVKMGLIHLPPNLAGMSPWEMAALLLQRDAWPHLTHLWFLYYLLLVTSLFLLVRWLMLAPGSARVQRAASSGFHRAISSGLAPVWATLLVLPLLSLMQGYGLDTPNMGLVVHYPVLIIYTFFFAIGWWLRRQPDLLAVLARRWKALLLLSVAMSVMAWNCQWLYEIGEDTSTRKWACALASGLTTNLGVFGWIGLFVALLARPSPVARYLSDSSYWVYLAHLPLIHALQVGLHGWDSVWIKLLVINAVSFAILLSSYQWCVRYTWVGGWLNGRRRIRREVASPVAVAAIR